MALEAGIGKFKYHDSRHTAGSDWGRQGKSEALIQLASGWATRQMVQRYTHLNEDDVAAAFGLKIDNKNDNMNAGSEKKRSVTA